MIAEVFVDGVEGVEHLEVGMDQGLVVDLDVRAVAIVVEVLLVLHVDGVEDRVADAEVSRVVGLVHLVHVEVGRRARVPGGYRPVSPFVHLVEVLLLRLGVVVQGRAVVEGADHVEGLGRKAHVEVGRPRRWLPGARCRGNVGASASRGCSR